MDAKKAKGLQGIMARFTPLASLLAIIASLELPAQVQFQEQGREHIPARLSFPNQIRAGDFDADGDLDLLIGESNLDRLRGTQIVLYRNEGDALFVPELTDMPGHLDFLLADFDGDGDEDVIVATINAPGEPTFWVNDGQGHFTYISGAGRFPGPADILANADLDADGDLDLVTAVEGDVRVWLNDGDAAYTETAFISGNGIVESILLADLDGDDDLDAAIAVAGIPFPGFPPYTLPGISFDKCSKILINDGSAQFTDETSDLLPGVFASSQFLAIDADGDGDTDLLDNINFVPGARLLLYDGSTFVPAFISNGALEAGPVLLVVDIDGDGDEDVAGHRGYLLNEGGVFQASAETQLPIDEHNFSLTASDIVAGDFDGDGSIDLVTGWPSGAKLFLNLGSRGFVDATARSLARSNVSGTVAMGDIDADGHPDLLAPVFSKFGLFSSQVRRGVAMINDGHGGFTDDTRRVIRTSPAYGMEQPHLLDLDGDGDADLIGVRGQSLILFRNDGAAGFLDVTAQKLPPLTALRIALGDMDGDSDIDLVITTPIQFLLNDGTGKFTFDNDRLPLILSANGLTVVDIDLDGDLDILSAPQRPHVQPPFLNDGQGNFTAAFMFPSPFYPFPAFGPFLAPGGPIFMGDLSGDDYPDILVNNRLWIQNPIAKTFDEKTSASLPSTFTSSLFENVSALGDIDDDGDLDIITRGTSILLNDGHAIFAEVEGRIPEPATFVDDLAQDLDQDGDVDLIGIKADRTLTVFFNHHRHLHAPHLARLGQPYRLDAYSMPGYGTETHQALFFFARSTAHIPIPSLGLVQLDPASIRILGTAEILPSDGMGSLELNIPNDPVLLDQEFFFQGVIMTSSNLLDARMTNAQREVILPW